MTDKLKIRHNEGVTKLTLNRPERLNAIDMELLEAIIETLQETRHDDTVRVVVLEGAGRSFCAGADIGQMVDRTPAEWEAIVDRYLDPVRLISDMEKPVIARCHGDVIGGGLGLALACDFRLAARESRYCAPFVNLGLAGCDMSMGYFLPRMVGLGRASDMMMTGRFVEADEALNMGLINRLVEKSALDDAVNTLAGEFAAGSGKALAYTKQAIRRSLDRDREAEFDYETFVQVQCLQSADHQERVAAFFKRKGN